MAEYLLFATERYALPILAPLAQALHASGQSGSAWFADGAAGASLPGVPDVGLQQALALRPRAVFSAANWVPPFIAGAKVQVFHGFNVQKRDSARGHFRVRGLFDLYCTQGRPRPPRSASWPRARATSPWPRPVGRNWTRCSAMTAA